MKKWILVFFALLFMVSMANAEQLDFSSPKQPTADAAGFNVRYIQIYPAPNQTIVVYFDWLDATGKTVWDSKLEISGQDFQDVMGFQIRAQDVGTAIGAGLKQLIYNKMASFYGVEFQ